MLREGFMTALRHRLATTDISQVKADVAPFVHNPQELQIWSNEYFLQLAEMMRFE